MRIRYVNTIEDIAAFNRYHCKASPLIARQRLILIWGFAWLLALIGIGHAMIEKSGFVLIPWFFVTTGWVVYYPKMYQRRLDRTVKKMVQEGSTAGLLCSHELEFDGVRLVERTSISENSTLLSGIQKVVRTRDFTFVYIGSIQAHVIPRAAVTEGAFESFSVAIGEACGRAIVA